MDIEAGARNFLQRRETDPRAYATNFRKTLIFLVLEGKQREIIPLAWALSATKEGWENTTRSMNSGHARTIAESQGLEQLENEHPLHKELWQASLDECLEITRQNLAPNQRRFSKRNGDERKPSDNSYYVLHPKLESAVSPQKAAQQPGFDGAAHQVTSNRNERDAA